MTRLRLIARTKYAGTLYKYESNTIGTVPVMTQKFVVVLKSLLNTTWQRVTREIRNSYEILATRMTKIYVMRLCQCLLDFISFYSCTTFQKIISQARAS